MLIWGVSNETQAHICFYFPVEAKPHLLISFLEERNPHHRCRLGCRIGCKKIRCWGVSLYWESKIVGVTINFVFLASSQSFYWEDLYFKIMYFFQQSIISSCLDKGSFPYGPWTNHITFTVGSRCEEENQYFSLYWMTLYACSGGCRPEWGLEFLWVLYVPQVFRIKVL